ncbi:alpha/beta hydrolase [Arthrobacter sp. ISL-85]|uniref:alpha/beta hydrolase n=1 Tax=Arthrobacter sp. ISL-85 TaxID=2819115 RepID=UPI001BE83C2F|nr:alpha/beta hydrolase [Arthrobacter sp. ISL-85]MBT2568875.1 alpha/beta hydrolase [Arthrobacter sp. ISL-85]
MGDQQGELPQGVVLVHGMWGVPEDWSWVQRALEKQPNLHVLTPDLPSHRSLDAGLLEDAEEVRAAIAASPAPAVVVGWSYGTDVVGIAAHGMRNVVRLVYVSSPPLRLQHEVRDVGWVDEMEHMLHDEHGRNALDGDWWLSEDEAGLRLPDDVRAFLKEHPRRFATKKTRSDPVPAQAWTEIPTTVLLGAKDNLTGAEQRAWAREAVADVREINTDHFALFNCPDVIAQVILEPLSGSTDMTERSINWKA